eukprot:m.231359 g.231359  ORF g.231359 m.231359 type:complete len:230 (-) comp18872_c0_seq4:163-852(-)
MSAQPPHSHQPHRLVVPLPAKPTPFTCHSAGQDHCLRTWDVESGSNVSTTVGSKVMTALSCSPHSGLVAAAEFDSVIRIYDPKSGSSVPTMSLASHRGPATSVAWSPSQSHQLISGSHGEKHNLKLWDVRSTSAPLHTLSAHTEHVLGVAWPTANTILSGSADRTFKVKQTWAHDRLCVFWGGTMGKGRAEVFCYPTHCTHALHTRATLLTPVVILVIDMQTHSVGETA